MLKALLKEDINMTNQEIRNIMYCLFEAQEGLIKISKDITDIDTKEKITNLANNLFDCAYTLSQIYNAKWK